jgi:hypothetical protein
LTIKITQIAASAGEVVLTVSYDFPIGSGVVKSFKLKKTDLYERLKQVEDLLGRAISLADAQLAIVAFTNEMRKGTSTIPEDFNFAPYINVELET